MKRLLLFLVLALPAFADSPPAWLVLPAPDRPPPTGASQWILHQSLVITQETPTTVRRKIRSAVMPLSNAAVQQCGCALPFTDGAEKLVSAEAWVMSPDGKQCRAFDGNNFLLISREINAWVWDQEKLACFDATTYLQSGWIFAWEIELRSEYGAFDRRWSPGDAQPVRFASLDVIPLPGGSVVWAAYPDALTHPTQAAGGAYHWQVENLPPAPTNVPKALDRDERAVKFYVLPPRLTKMNTPTWADAVRVAREQVDPAIAATPEMSAQAHQLAGAGSLWPRIRPVCESVQREITYLAITIDRDSMAGYRPHPALEVLKNRYGDCKDKAAATCALLHELGVDARVALVNRQAPRTNTLDWPSLWFNHAIVAIRATEPVPAGWPAIRAHGVDYVLFDPTDEQVPLGLLPIEDTGGLALVLADGVDIAVEIPVPAPDLETRQTELRIQLAADGSAAFAIKESLLGLSAALAADSDRTDLLADRTHALERRIQRQVPLISDLVWQSGSGAGTGNWQLEAKFSGQFVGKRFGRSMFFPSDLLSSVPVLEAWDDDLPGWYTLAPRKVVRALHVQLPAGFTVAELPPSWSLHTPAGEGTMTMRAENGEVVGEFSLTVPGGVLSREQYLAARQLLDAARAAERRPMLLRRIEPPPAPPAAKPT